MLHDAIKFKDSRGSENQERAPSSCPGLDGGLDGYFDTKDAVASGGGDASGVDGLRRHPSRTALPGCPAAPSTTAMGFQSLSMTGGSIVLLVVDGPSCVIQSKGRCKDLHALLSEPMKHNVLGI